MYLNFHETSERTPSIVEHVSSVRFASPHTVSRLNGPCDMVFSIVGLPGWILRNGLLHRGTPRHDLFLRGLFPNGFLPQRIHAHGLSGNCLLHRGTLWDDLMQRATLQTGLLHRGTLQWGLLNHDTLWNCLSDMVFSLVGLSDLVVSIVRLSGRGSPSRPCPW